jgi:hypothetical protein
MVNGEIAQGLFQAACTRLGGLPEQKCTVCSLHQRLLCSSRSEERTSTACIIALLVCHTDRAGSPGTPKAFVSSECRPRKQLDQDWLDTVRETRGETTEGCENEPGLRGR